MDRDKLEAAAANYPYLQGLWTIPFGLMMFVTGISNLENGPDAGVLIALFLFSVALAGAASLLINRHYQQNFGTVVPTRSRRMRAGAALAAFAIVLFFGASRLLFWELDSPRCIYASAFALAALTYYAILVGPRRYHLVVWGLLFIAGVLPIWGDLGNDRDAWAMFPMGIALIVSGLLDQRQLSRSFAATDNINADTSDVEA